VDRHPATIHLQCGKEGGEKKKTKKKHKKYQRVTNESSHSDKYPLPKVKSKNGMKSKIENLITSRTE
jgi:hypothetical protein